MPFRPMTQLLSPSSDLTLVAFLFRSSSNGNERWVCLFKLFRWLQRRTPQKFKPVILVTGCSSGIGWALTEFLYTDRNYRVIVTARATSVDRLRNAFQESERFWIRPLDVTSESDQIILFQFFRISKSTRHLHVFVNLS